MEHDEESVHGHVDTDASQAMGGKKRQCHDVGSAPLSDRLQELRAKCTEFFRQKTVARTSASTDHPKSLAEMSVGAAPERGPRSASPCLSMVDAQVPKDAKELDDVDTKIAFGNKPVALTSASTDLPKSIAEVEVDHAHAKLVSESGPSSASPCLSMAEELYDDEAKIVSESGPPTMEASCSWAEEVDEQVVEDAKEMLVGCDVDFGEEVAAPDLSDIAASVLRDEVPAQTHALGTATERTGLALQDAKAELFPPFLREDHQEASNPAFREMQEMKMRAVEHVRWRSANCNTSDPYFACLLTQMRSDVRGFLKEGERRVTTLRFLESITVDKHEEPQLFLLGAHTQALKITEFTKNDNLLNEYAALFKQLPSIAAAKLGAKNLETDHGCAKALVKLVNKHSGELVEIDATRGGWSLRESAPGSASAAKWGEQWYCTNGGQALPPNTSDEQFDAQRNDCGLPKHFSLTDTACCMDVEMKTNPDVVAGRVALLDVRPDWKRQVYRTFCPCVGTEKWIWCRTGPVISLGQLFLILGRPSVGWNAAQIYYYYCTLRIVATKRRKHVPGGGRRDWPTDATPPLTGQHLAKTSAAAVKAEFNRVALVEEYSALHGMAMPDITQERAKFDEIYLSAVKYIHMNLLQDLSPPWIGARFTQALPGEGLLSQYLKPTFLQWDAEQAKQLFGKHVMGTFERAAKVVSLSVAGVLGRPLYVCTQLKPNGSTCLNAAAMSPLLDRFGGHRAFICKRCPHVLGDTPLRMMRLYILVPKEP